MGRCSSHHKELAMIHDFLWNDESYIEQLYMLVIDIDILHN